MLELSGAATKQGELWGHAVRDWVALMEPSSHPVWNAVLDAAQVQPGTRFLDAGCGAGGASLLALERGADVYGIDPSVNLLTIARERMPKSDFRIAELDDLPFPNGEFDAAVAVNSMQYAVNPQVALHELGRVCRADGRVVVAVFSDPERCDMAHVYRAIRGLFERTPAGAGPFELSAETALRGLVDSVRQVRFEAIGEVDCPYECPDIETAVRGLMAAGGTWRAVEIVGEARVREAVRDVVKQFQTSTGDVRMLNRFRYVVAIRTAVV